MSTITLQDEDRIDDLLALWRWRDELDYRLRIARLRFEVVGLDAEEQEKLERAVSEFKSVAAYLKECAA